MRTMLKIARPKGNKSAHQRNRNDVLVAIIACAVCISKVWGQNDVRMNVIGTDTSFTIVAAGTADSRNTRRYQDESVILHNPYGWESPTEVWKGLAGVENNIELGLRNDSPNCILNPVVSINGKEILYSVDDLIREIPLQSAKDFDDSLKILTAFLNANMLHWTVSSDFDTWAIHPLRNYNVFGAGMCDQIAKTVTAILGRLGYSDVSQVDIGDNSHSITLVQHGGRSYVVDADLRVFYTTFGSERLAGFDELLTDQFLVRRQHHYGNRYPAGYYDDGVALLYSSLLPRYRTWVAEPDSFPLVLRPRESYRFFYNRRPEKYQFYHVYYSPLAPPATVSTGVQEYEPAIDETGLGSLQDTGNVSILHEGVSNAIVSRVPGNWSSMVLSMSNPYAILGAKLFLKNQCQDSLGLLEVGYRGDHSGAFTIVKSFGGRKAWQGLDSVDFSDVIQPIGNPILNQFEIEIRWKSEYIAAIQLDSISVSVSFQFNPNALPHVNVGKNEVRIRSNDGNALGGLTIWHSWSVIDSLIQPPTVRVPISPAPNSTVTTGSPRFRWGLPPGWNLSQISDVHIQVSSSRDFQTVVSPSYDVLASLFGDDRITSWSAPDQNPLGPGTYYWRIAFRSSDGVYSEWSDPWEFRVNVPGIVMDRHVTYSADSCTVAWQASSIGSTPSSFVVLGSNERGFSVSDSVIVDTVSSAMFVVFPNSEHRPYAFYRIAALDNNGVLGAISPLIPIDSLRLWISSPKYATMGDSVSVRLGLIEPFDKYAASGKPVSITTDKVEIDETLLPIGFKVESGLISGVLRTAADTLLEVRGRSSISGRQYLRQAPITINFPPTVVESPDTLAREDFLFRSRVRAADSDSARLSDRIVFSIQSAPKWISIDSLTGLLVGIPLGNDVGSAMLGIQIQDQYGGHIDTAFAVRVLHTNHAPIIAGCHMGMTFVKDAAINLQVSEGALFTARALVSDPDSTNFGDRLTYRLTLRPAWLSIDSATGMLSGTPSAADLGQTSFELLVDDGKGGVASRAFALTVVHTNHAPVLHHLPPVVFAEDSSAWLSLRSFAADTDDAVHLLKWNARLALQGGDSSLFLNLDTTSAILQITSARDYVCTNLPVLLQVTDPLGSTASDTLRVTITPVNDAPVLAAIDTLRFKEHDSLFVPFSRWFTVVRDPDDPDSLLTWNLVGTSQMHIARTDSGFRFEPGHFWNGTATYGLIASDHAGLADTTTLTVTVDPVNDPPFIANMPDTIAALGEHYEYLLHVHDPEDTAFVFTLVGPSWLSIDSTGDLSGVAQTAGTFVVTIYVCDPHGGCDTLRFDLSVDVLKSVAGSEQGIPQDFVLDQNYPNPFNPSTTIRYGLPERSQVRMEVYTMLGQRVQEMDLGELEAGYHQVAWQPRNLASGAYIIVLHGKGSITEGREVRMIRRAMLLK
jgi:hypothetical protein